MFRFSQRSRGGIVYPTVLGLFGYEYSGHDKITVDTPSAKKVKKELDVDIADGWEGLQKMFSKQEPGGVSVELHSCIQLGLCSTIMGFVWGGIENTKFTVTDFKERNQATIYTNTYEAQKSVADKVAKDFFKGGVKLGTKCGAFLLCFSLISTSFSTYRGKSSITHFSASGFITGALFTLNRGLLGAFSGGMIGLFLGTFSGAALMGTLWLGGTSMDEVRKWQYIQYQKRVDAENKAYLKEREHSTDPGEQIANYIIKPEEREKGRILDKLENVAMTPEQLKVVVPELPPESMFRKEKR